MRVSGRIHNRRSLARHDGSSLPPRPTAASRPSPRVLTRVPPPSSFPDPTSSSRSIRTQTSGSLLAGSPSSSRAARASTAGRFRSSRASPACGRELSCECLAFPSIIMWRRVSALYRAVVIYARKHGFCAPWTLCFASSEPARPISHTRRLSLQGLQPGTQDRTGTTYAS